jgi:hypothetical protein
VAGVNNGLFITAAQATFVTPSAVPAATARQSSIVPVSDTPTRDICLGGGNGVWRLPNRKRRFRSYNKHRSSSLLASARFDDQSNGYDNRRSIVIDSLHRHKLMINHHKCGALRQEFLNDITAAS